MLTDEEWREFQSIPNQGYSHRAWVDHKIKLAQQEAAAKALEEFVQEYQDLTPEMFPSHEGSPDYWQGCSDAIEYAMRKMLSHAAWIREGKIVHREAHLECCGGKGYCEWCYERWPCPAAPVTG